MEKKYLLKGLDCPHCSALIEREIGGLDGVKQASVNLIKQTLTVEGEHLFFDGGLDKIKTVVTKHEPDVAVLELSEFFTENGQAVCSCDTDTCHCHDDNGCHCHGEECDDNHIHGQENNHNYSKSETDGDDVRGEIIRITAGAVLFAVGAVLRSFTRLHFGFSLALFVAAYLVLGTDILAKAAKNIVRGRVFDENFLMSLSTIGAFAIGEYPEGAAVMLFYRIGEFFQELSVRRSRKSIADLMDLRPDTARVIRDGREQAVHPSQVSAGETVTVNAGEKIPLDGIIIGGQSCLDTKALTGEAVPCDVGEGDEVLSGCINIQGVLKIKVTKTFGQSTAAKIISLVENASEKKAKTENFITTFARYYTPTVVILAFLLAVIPPVFTGHSFTMWLHRALVFLVVSCPCALVVSVPLAYFSGIGMASKRGILIKGSNYLEALNKADTVVFDKTGTLTKGCFSVRKIVTSNGFTSDRVLEYAAAAQCRSGHPIAKSVMKKYDGEIDKSKVSEQWERSGYGVGAVYDGVKILAGNAALMAENGIDIASKVQGGTVVYVSADGRYAGCIVITDEIKEDSKAALQALKKLGIRRTVMLTGDSEETAKAVCSQVGVDEYFAKLLPDEKVAKLEQIKGEQKAKSTLIYAGDGINDAPVLACADIGVAMGALGSDAAIEAADIVLMTDEVTKLAQALKIASSTKRVVLFNIIFALIVKAAVLLLGAFGIAGTWEAVFADVGVAFIAVLNSVMLSYRRGDY